MRLALFSSLALAGRHLCWLALVLGLALPAAARTKHAAHSRRAARRHHVRLPKMLPTVIPAAREGYETVLRGRVSWYGKYFQGRKTSSGERYNRHEFTCAHKTLPFGTRLRVTNLDNGATVVVRVTDRGPFRHQRIIDLAEVAARPLGIVEAGAATVVAEVVEATTPLGPAETPDNLAVLREGDPNPAAPFTAYLLPDTALAAPTPAVAESHPGEAAPRFEVQAGAFATPEAARAVLARILTIDQALPASVVTTTANGRPLNRVVIGQLSNWLAAETVRRNLQFWGITGQVKAVPAPDTHPDSLAHAAATPTELAALRR